MRAAAVLLHIAGVALAALTSPPGAELPPAAAAALAAALRALALAVLQSAAHTASPRPEDLVRVAAAAEGYARALDAGAVHEGDDGDTGAREAAGECRALAHEARNIAHAMLATTDLEVHRHEPDHVAPAVPQVPATQRDALAPGGRRV
jgi:hypothetical protein